MSADNGIYIHYFKNGWKVTEGSAVENAFEGGHAMEKYFSGGMTFKTENGAWKYARKLYKKIMGGYGIIEYGISEI